MKVFENLDAFIRQRLRRYIIKNKDQKQKVGNLLLTNEELKNLGLKSLVDIKIKYASKKRHILGKSGKKKDKIGDRGKLAFLKKPNFYLDNYWQKAILRELQKLTKNVKRIKNKISRMEKKLDKPPHHNEH